MLNSLGSTPETRMYYQEDGSIDIGLSCDTVVKEGAMVKMKADGTLTPVTSATDKPFGVVAVGNAAVDTKVTVKTYFVAIMLAISEGITDEGKFLACTGIDATTKKSKFKVAVTTDYITAVCLEGAINGYPCKVGVLRAPMSFGDIPS